MAEETEQTTTDSSTPVPDESAVKTGSDDVESKKSDTPREGSVVGNEESRDTGTPASTEEEVTTPVEGDELTAGAADLKAELDKIVVVAPTTKIEPLEIFDPSEFPESYKENLPKEKLVLAFAENFRRQYVHLYRDRKPLFLNPVNECGIEKFVCTTIRSTQLPYKALYDWDGAAEFVADYINFKALEPAHEQPRRLLSPSTVLTRQQGNCFDYSCLLACFLIGAGYDAYVVSGYACQETCLMDETREICPFLKPKEQVKQEEEKKQQKKYTVRPPKDLRSKFEIKMQQRETKAAEDELSRQRKKKKVPTATLR